MRRNAALARGDPGSLQSGAPGRRRRRGGARGAASREPRPGRGQVSRRASRSPGEASVGLRQVRRRGARGREPAWARAGRRRGSEARPIAPTGTPRWGAVPGGPRSPQPGPAPGLSPTPAHPTSSFPRARASPAPALLPSRPRLSSQPPPSPPSPASLPAPWLLPPFLVWVCSGCLFGFVLIGPSQPKLSPTSPFFLPSFGVPDRPHSSSLIPNLGGMTCFTDEKIEAEHVESLQAQGLQLVTGEGPPPKT